MTTTFLTVTLVVSVVALVFMAIMVVFNLYEVITGNKVPKWVTKFNTANEKFGCKVFGIFTRE